VHARLPVRTPTRRIAARPVVAPPRPHDEFRRDAGQDGEHTDYGKQDLQHGLLH
jgi:hypothetical protein